MDIFYEVRDVPGLKKKPSTSELLDWLKLLLHEDMPLEVLQRTRPAKAIPPLHGALLKNEQDVMLFERLAFMPAAGRLQSLSRPVPWLTAGTGVAGFSGNDRRSRSASAEAVMRGSRRDRRARNCPSGGR